MANEVKMEETHVTSGQKLKESAQSLSCPVSPCHRTGSVPGRGNANSPGRRVKKTWSRATADPRCTLSLSGKQTFVVVASEIWEILVTAT